MKKILMSLFTIAIVGALITGGTMAFFSDVEEAPGTFTAGTIDIAVAADGESFENPWTESFTITEEGKPSQVWYIEFVIKNVGTNPCVIWKHLTNFETSDGLMLWPEDSPLCSSEPEFVACGGLFRADGSVRRGTYEPVNNIQKWILYDLYSEVILPIADGDSDQWHQTQFVENVTLADVMSLMVPLGSIPPGGQMRVIQSYHLDYDTPNKYQGDTLTFDIELYAQQMEGTTVLMENKLKAQPGEPSVVQFDDDDDGTFLDEDLDDMWGKLDYNTLGPEFVYTFEAHGLQINTPYSLIYYADPWAGDNPGALIATFGADSNGNIPSTSGSVELGMNLPDPADDNALLGAKIWLVPSDDYDGTKMIVYNESLYLFETHLIWYNDTDVP